jgi:hypothetical protein
MSTHSTTVRATFHVPFKEAYHTTIRKTFKISNFETYSGECANRSAADAKLHAYLQQVAGAARMLFETALEHVAIAEGLPLAPAKITKIGRTS